MPKIIENPQQIILEHAERILEQQGYEALNMRAVAKSCGIATGTIYNYFPTKTELLLQMMTNYWEMHFVTIDNISSSDEDLFVKLRYIFDIMEKFVLNYRKVWMNMHQASDDLNEAENLHHNHDYMRRLIEKVEQILLVEMQRKTAAFHYPLSARDMASFIIQNDLSICHMKNLSYPSLELLLRKVLQ